MQVEIRAVRERASLKLQARAVNIQDNIGIELKAEGIVNEEDMEEAEAIIKEGVQVALDKLEEYQALGCYFFILGHLLRYKGILGDNVLGRGGNIVVQNTPQLF